MALKYNNMMYYVLVLINYHKCYNLLKLSWSKNLKLIRNLINNITVKNEPIFLSISILYYYIQIQGLQNDNFLQVTLSHQTVTKGIFWILTNCGINKDKQQQLLLQSQLKQFTIWIKEKPNKPSPATHKYSSNIFFVPIR